MSHEHLLLDNKLKFRNFLELFLQRVGIMKVLTLQYVNSKFNNPCDAEKKRGGADETIGKEFFR
jgi:hypothetical protein